MIPAMQVGPFFPQAQIFKVFSPLANNLLLFARAVIAHS